MTVKSQRGRRRYVAFTTSPGLSKNGLIAGMARFGRTYNIIQCGDGMAIVRCAPDTIYACIAAVREGDPQATAVLTSGTLRTLRDRYPVLRANTPPKPPRSRLPTAPPHAGGIS